MADRVDTLDGQEAALALATLSRDCLVRCATDGLFWLRFVLTRDESDPDHTVKPFPIDLEYVRLLWQILVDNNRVAVAKSRQMLVSWIVCAFCVWWARFRPHQAVYWQTQQWKDAIDMVALPEGGRLGRCQFIEANLPTWMRVKTKASEGQLAYLNGSIIQALPGGADQIRGKVASIIVEDEFAKQQEASGVWTAVAPLVQKGARVIIVSTPNGVENQFATLWHGRSMSSPGA